jgi:hypothetical protein
MLTFFRKFRLRRVEQRLEAARKRFDWLYNQKCPLAQSQLHEARVAVMNLLDKRTTLRKSIA